ncbi:MAG: hypothetical protein WKF88_05720 [Ferruginibacter sp.]
MEESVTALGSSFGVFGTIAVAALVPVISKLIELATAETDAERATKLLNESLKAGSHASAEASTQVDTLKLKFNLAKQGILSKKDVLEEYNNTLGKTLGVTKDFNTAEQTTIDNAETYIAIIGLKAEAQALANLKIKKSEEKLNADLNLDDNSNLATKVVDYFRANELFPGEKYEELHKESRKRFNSNIVAEKEKDIDALSKREVDVQTRLAILLQQFQDKPKSFTKEKSEKARKEIVNIYQQELQKLKEDLAKIEEKVFTDEGTISKAVEESFKKRSLAFERAFKKGQLSPSQLKSLQENLSNLETLTLQKQLKDFQTQKAAYLKRISDELQSIQDEESLARIAGIQNNFERERQTIEVQSEKTETEIKKRRDKVIADLKQDASKNGLSLADIQPQIDNIKSVYGKLLDDLEVIKAQKLQHLSFDTFESLSKEANRVLDAGNLGISQGSLINIQKQSELFNQGKISYKQYQKELTNIAKFEAHERFLLEKNFLDGEILRRQQKLDSDQNLTPDQTIQLQDEIRKLQQQLASATKADTITGAGNKKTSTDATIEKIVQYSNAIGTLANSVISFWAKMNEAEQKALDRSISIQEKRVEAAQRVATKGNAEYLQLEEERLQALEIKRENAARRQLAINAALQASQVITALISGIAQGVTLGGPLGAIIALTTIVGAIASGYAIAQSLKPPEPAFFVGTEDTGPGGNVDNKKGFRAVLHPHERVLTAEQNKKLGGISNEKLVQTWATHRIMAKENYPSKPPLQLNLAAMDRATEITNLQNVRLAGLMEQAATQREENIRLQRHTIKAINNLEVIFKVDQRGLYLGLKKMKDDEDISKKT